MASSQHTKPKHYYKEFPLVNRIICAVSRSLKFLHISRHGLTRGLWRRCGIPSNKQAAEEAFLMQFR